ncbi:helix-turn-helix domain-containing protein [Leuconostoc mesenteroides]|uniref:helix-turn-helix domain-containing protein n=1 Tax=Leuconostoc mesenteroides TaxID=1245 RepID=UPI0015EFDDF4|nr:helix-turn-helix domain-containing protein [Leuconostoc mesenteroides]MCJ2159847.1 helix-turn-helix domain-containing protein [Leuconostoc mesenteroides]MCM6836354.1 helix-turn-helix domain-containing protein [Leuconostoc mesenteroides]
MSTYKVIDNQMAQALLIKRRQQSMTLADMAKETNVTRDILSQIERGKKQVVQDRVFGSLISWLSKED